MKKEKKERKERQLSLPLYSYATSTGSREESWVISHSVTVVEIRKGEVPVPNWGGFLLFGITSPCPPCRI